MCMLHIVVDQSGLMHMLNPTRWFENQILGHWIEANLHFKIRHRWMLVNFLTQLTW